jgi:hypothetical protein
MKKTNKLTAGLVLGAILATGASAYGIVQPKFKKGATFGIQAKSVSFDDKLGLKDTTVYGVFYDINKDTGEPLAWGIKLGFELDYANMDDSEGNAFTYYDYYLKLAPTYAVSAGDGNVKFYAGGKFGYNGFEESTGYTYGYMAGVEYNYKALNAGVDYFSGTTDIEGIDFQINEIKTYIGYNF